MANPFVHVERNTPDPKKAKEFYSKLFQGQLEDITNPAVPDGTGTMIKVGEGTGGGFMQQIPSRPAGRLAQVGVDDVRPRRKSGIARRRGHEGRHGSDGHGLARG